MSPFRVPKRRYWSPIFRPSYTAQGRSFAFGCAWKPGKLAGRLTLSGTLSRYHHVQWEKDAVFSGAMTPVICSDCSVPCSVDRLTAWPRRHADRAGPDRRVGALEAEAPWRSVLTLRIRSPKRLKHRETQMRSNGAFLFQTIG